MPVRPLYSSPWARLTENVSEEDHGQSTPCWIGQTRDADRCGYQRLYCFIPGLTGREGGSPRRHLMAHTLAYVIHHLRLVGTGTMATWNDIWLGVLEVRESGCQLDHACGQPGCRNPMHLELLDRLTHQRLTWARAQERAEARRAMEVCDPSDYVEF